MTENVKNHKNILKKIGIFFLIAIFLILVCISGYLFYQYQNVKKQLADDPLLAQKTAQETTKKLVAEISQFMILPKNEVPTLATVTDIKKLKNQPFFQQAKNGDQLLVFTKEKLAIIYDPKIHKVVNVGPVTFAVQPTPLPQAKIILRNGTETSGLTQKAEEKLQKMFPKIDVEKKEQAAILTYTKTFVVLLNPTAKIAAESLANFYNVSIATLPAQEKKPEGIDILVILGKDQVTDISATPSIAQ